MSHRPGEPIGRRAVLAGLAGVAALGWAAPQPASAAVSQPALRPRSDWASGLRSPAPEAEDVKFLLVHHTESGNDYSQASVPGQLRSFYELHTTSPRNWPDIAYNFLIDRYGTIWEGRTGSLAGPVRGSATGGSQGFAQLCCFIGSHTTVPPTAAAQTSMSALLAWLAARYSVNLHAGKTISFVSRGSNKWPAGSTVITDPVAGHRDMSLTTCPGDACYPLVRGALLTGAQALVDQAAGTQAATSTAEPPGASPSGVSAAGADSATSASTSPSAATGTEAATAEPTTTTSAAAAGQDGGLSPLAIGAGAGGAVLAVGAGYYLRWAGRRRAD